MKVLKAADVSKQITCKCGSVLKYVPQDIKTHYPSQEEIEIYGNNAVPIDYLECPVCGENIYFNYDS